MVFMTSCSLSGVKNAKFSAKRKFIDSLRLYVCGGAGGMGLPKYGGVGGNGGDVFVIAETDMTLKRVQKNFPNKRCIAGSGGNSMKHRILGELGKHCYIRAPVGISVLSDFKKVLGELNHAGDSVLVAKGGSGGGPENQYSGEKGQTQSVILDLKIIADVGLVGFPNAGKSTLLKGVSRATPKIAEYPFTTIQPNVAIMNYEDYRQISVADLPGLIEGAHYNIGMGHKFLKHVERTKLLLFVVDINGFQLSPKHIHRSALENIVLLNKELEMYQEDLVTKPALLAINKMDCDGAKDAFVTLKADMRNLSELIKEFDEQLRPKHLMQFDEVIPISAKEDPESLMYLKKRIRDFLDIYHELQREESEEFRQWTRQAMIESGQKIV